MRVMHEYTTSVKKQHDLDNPDRPTYFRKSLPIFAVVGHISDDAWSIYEQQTRGIIQSGLVDCLIVT